MLWYLLRVGLILLWHSCFGRRATGDANFRVRRRAWPWHCDAYLHVNNAAYLRIAEDARWVWTARTPLLRRALAERWLFLVGGVDIVYRREIPLMSTFEIVNRVVGLDERWLYFSQEFVLPSGRIACRALVRSMVRSPRGPISPKEVVLLAELPLPAPSEEVDRMRSLSELQLATLQQGAGPAAATTP